MKRPLVTKRIQQTCAGVWSICQEAIIVALAPLPPPPPHTHTHTHARMHAHARNLRHANLMPAQLGNGKMATMNRQNTRKL